MTEIVEEKPAHEVSPNTIKGGNGETMKISNSNMSSNEIKRSMKHYSK